MHTYVLWYVEKIWRKLAIPDTKKCVGNKFVSARRGPVSQMCRLLAIGPTCRRHVGNIATQAPRCPPTRRKRRGHGFSGGTRRWAGRGPIGRLACACWSLPPPPLTSLAMVRRRRRHRRRVGGGVSLRSGRRTEYRKKCLCLIWPPTGNSNTKTNQKHTRTMQEENLRRFDR